MVRSFGSPLGRQREPHDAELGRDLLVQLGTQSRVEAGAIGAEVDGANAEPRRLREVCVPEQVIDPGVHWINPREGRTH